MPSRCSDRDQASTSGAESSLAAEVSRLSATHIDQLPAELLQHILDLLPTHQLLQLVLVSRSWRLHVLAVLARRTHLDLGRLRIWRRRVEYGDGVIPTPYCLLKPSREQLQQLLKLQPQLRTLRCTLRRRELLDCADIRQLDSGLGANLTSVDLVDGNFSAEVITAICRAAGPSLERLQLRPVYVVHRPLDLTTLLPLLPGLRTFSIIGGSHKLGQEESVLRSRLPDAEPAEPCLRRLLQPGDLGTLARSCRRLQTLRVRPATAVSSEDVAAVAALPQLRRLELHMLQRPPHSWLPADGMRLLRHLHLSGSLVVTDAFLQMLPQLMPQLRSLGLMCCVDCSQQGIGALAGLRQLQALDLRHTTEVTEQLLSHIGSRTRLRQLHISSCGHTPSLRSLLHVVARCPTLELLGLAGFTPDIYLSEYLETCDELACLAVRDREVVVRFDSGLSYNLREWISGVGQDVTTDVMRGGHGGRYENWFGMV